MDLSEYMSGSYFKPEEVKAAHEAGKPLVGNIITEPVVVKTQFKDANGDAVEKVEFDITLEDGREKIASLNKTSVLNLGKAFGAESQKWIGKKVKFNTALTQTPKGLKDVIYVFPVL
jgi:hypothetical protein